MHADGCPCYRTLLFPLFGKILAHAHVVCKYRYTRGSESYSGMAEPASSRALAALLLLLLFLPPFPPNVAVSQSIIKNLPGFPGDLPFKLETGYVGIGEVEDVQLFYYFIESESDPKVDPLFLWLTGGPGCSAFSGLVYEIGPLTFNYDNFSGKLPTFELNPFSWTKVASIIFVDAPVGTGFSYSKTTQGYNTGDSLSVKQTYEFLRKWLINHSNFLWNPLYITGDSYSGLLVPIIVQEIHNGNELGLLPHMNLKGYVLGNPVTDEYNHLNARVPYAHRMALISDELYKAVKSDCNGHYANADPNNAPCIANLEAVTRCTDSVYLCQILEPSCSSWLSPRPSFFQWDKNVKENIRDFMDLPSQRPKQRCREYNYLFSYTWANDKTVQNALHVREGTVREWVRCNWTLSYTYDVENSVGYHRNISREAYRGLVYSGDHDMSVPHIATEDWIRLLNLSITDNWRPWFVDGQSGGFTEEYNHNNFHLTYATIKGGGHTAPEYKPKECHAMISRWLAFYPL
ncbi:serine carboxypeptidase-like 1 isoform X1 [Malania oleifera]|uniref:serine carboxypeptidase-like 1 isoform X1 n=1 Tax=Malania oleifera TaxID=397392 RepID=UPI0025AEBA6A|nr:serine carboxypeptidase-like 1 isoform X1 [Malania oleifera]